ncbi:hypothetical protein A2331_05895 [Candidatus Falkowbacteria bacterium RIFOXYB2_FULL_34_18]|uniref:Uncharacterized protein n=1 Tax=Candidatus Falkowbacteria bacterium RIFOXYD2_FULL_34_120 TaxID=1798007 RepID=A0A1F5TPP6_9BACT|nr:MAG: hypothetical protein A2331_05895 [Candidatus Falkowbacteria bacterium RIFOXYB2_FULL_34_18]OGF29079.1 MAG: hypothetical protein A2500_03500 [Candidatus Falkowbacteria bacterium RIFOXYC12_FULL_34_55]OGF36111.1 MAG: hypothetical protein A2466_03470 [Candidatus Falkowbacteria bacterium RIFOXYC2_FULL_34_220]OGF38563.1 MAG: hypothetical protein A2515_04730 [Candidatus Falkowbacteria bacterium RIFOXYD12_FULL_34_57]OGF40764.1 MAG: hypothetical protein A2531_07025 [Candidatus Falkowbacteria bact
MEKNLISKIKEKTSYTEQEIQNTIKALHEYMRTKFTDDQKETLEKLSSELNMDQEKINQIIMAYLDLKEITIN